MNRENERVSGKEAAIDDYKHKKIRDLAIYGSVFYTDAYRTQMAKYKKTKNKGDK